MKRVTTRARVTVMLDMDLDDSWGADCKLEQVLKQAESGARSRFRKLEEDTQGRIRLVNVVKVVAVTEQDG